MLHAPVSNVPAYLATRKPVADYAQEESLYITLPSASREDLKYLLRACHSVQSLVKGGLSVTKSCDRAYSIYRSHLTGSRKTFRALYDTWTKSDDWVTLVNRTRAGAAWQIRNNGLPEAFLTFCAQQFGRYKRADGKRQALLAIKRQWITGRDSDGVAAPIPGYGLRSPSSTDYPTGWSYSNILRQIKARALFTDSVRLMLHESTAAARTYLPQTKADRSGLLFLQVVEFDDVKCDFLIVDPESGQVCDLWLLVARDRATAILLGFGLRPAISREDGTQQHLRLRDMKQLVGWLLERYGLPPYEVTYKIEHGTATLTEGSRAALREMLPGRINISYSSMIGGASPAGYQQRAIGNSKGKASLESHNRLMHTMLADRPGQTGPLYNVRPADLQARARETAEILKSTQHLPAHLRSQVGYPILTINQAREHLHRIFRLQNERTEHALQGFEDIVECWDEQRKLWLPQSVSVRENPSPTMSVRIRKESPIERCARLIAPYQDQWSRVSPEIITAFYEHTSRQVTVQPSGLIEFRTEDRQVEFCPCESMSVRVSPGTKLLGYYHPDDPAFLHLTDGQGRILGTWIRRARATDPETIQQAIRYTQTALSAAKAQAADYATPDREALAAMRARNESLLAAQSFEAVSEAPSSELHAPSSPVATALLTSRASVKAAEKQTKKDIRDTRDLLRKAAEQF